MLLLYLTDGNLSFDSHHVNYLSSSRPGKLCQINSVRRLITKVLSVILNSDSSLVQQIILLFQCLVRNNTTECPETAAITEFCYQDTNWKKKI